MNTTTKLPEVVEQMELEQEPSGIELFSSVEGFLDDILLRVDESELGAESPTLRHSGWSCGGSITRGSACRTRGCRP